MSNQGPEETVREWLAKQGYPLEYEAARELRRAGFRTLQGWSYRDEQAGDIKARELDVMAFMDGAVPDDHPDQRARVTLAVECKHATGPWVVLTSRHPPDWTPLATQWMESLLRQAGVSVADLLPLPSATGFSVSMANPKGEGVAREAVTQATNGARAVIERGPYGGSPPELAVPVVVVRGALFTLGYDDAGGEHLDAVPWIRMVWHGSPNLDAPTLVDVVTSEYWVEHVESLRSTSVQVLSRVDSGRADVLAREAAERQPKIVYVGGDRDGQKEAQHQGWTPVHQIKVSGVGGAGGHYLFERTDGREHYYRWQPDPD